MNSYFHFRQTHSFLLHKTLIDEPFMWITVMFYMSCLDGTHSLQRMIRSWCKATFLQICSNKETNSSTYWITWGWVTLNYYFYNLITRPRTNWYVFFLLSNTKEFISANEFYGIWQRGRFSRGKIYRFLTECYYMFQKNSENRYESLSLILLWYCRSSFQCMRKSASRKFYKIYDFVLHRSNNMKLSKQRQKLNLGVNYLCI